MKYARAKSSPFKSAVPLLKVLSFLFAITLLLGIGLRFIPHSDPPISPTLPPSTQVPESLDVTTAPAEPAESTESATSAETIPSYETEAIRISEMVKSQQTDSSFSFLAFSDLHENGVSSAGNQTAGTAAALIRDAVKIDFAVLLGDITAGTETTTIEEGIAEMEAANNYLHEAFSGIPNFRTVGNHDALTYSFPQNGAYLDNEEIYPYIGIYNEGAVNAEHPGGYCYRDFTEHKIRVISLNTSDMENVSVTDNLNIMHMSASQLQWFAAALDLSDKSDAQEWGILILSHVPLDFWDLVNSAGKILDAYTTGTSTSFTWEHTQISYDYTNKASAEIIANIHGHNHCFLADHMYLTNQSGAMYLSPIMRICIPNACFDRNNERGLNGVADSNGIEFGETTTYPKTIDSAENTAFNVVTIDREKKIIYCANYGAGYDREISYAADFPADHHSPFSPETAAPSGAYVNLVPAAQELLSNDSTTLDGIGFRNHAYLSTNTNLLGHDAECVTTGGIPYQIPSHGVPPAIYIWGATLDHTDHVRFFIFDQQKRNVILHAAGAEIANYFTVETLGDMYYKLTPIPSDNNSLLYSATQGRADNGFIAWTLKGVGNNLIISMNDPILQ